MKLVFFVGVNIKEKEEKEVEFKISVIELQNIVAKLANVIRINNDDTAGMVYIKAGDSLEFSGTNGHVNVVINANEYEIIDKGKSLCKFGDIKGYIMRFVPLAEDYGTENFHFIVGEDEGKIKTKTLFRDSKPAYKTLKFELYNPAMYPVVKPFGKAQFILNSNILKQGIDKVLHCIDPTEIRNSLKGLSVVINNNEMTFAGTNGVSLVEDIIDVSVDVRQGMYLFKHDLSAILRSVLDDDSQVFVSIEGRHMYLKSNNIYIVGGLIIGENYPDYKAMFGYKEIITFPRADFTDTIFTIQDVLDPEDNHRITLNFNKNKLLIKNDRVEAVQEFDGNFEAELDMDVNGVFLASLLKDFVGKDMEIRFVPENNYLTFVSKDDDKHTALLTVVLRR